MGKVAITGHDSQWVRGLLDPAAYAHPVRDLQIIETHISWVILTGDFAYKIKKPVDLGFVDFSTLERRRFFCDEELRLNRRTAPDLYLEVVPICAAPAGLRVGREPAVEYAVRMRQFDAGARLDVRLKAGAIGIADICNAGAQVAAFHRGLPQWKFAEPELAGRRAPRPALNNFQHLCTGLFSNADRCKLADLRNWTIREARNLANAFRSRAAAGMIRECHGDLHLANLFVAGTKVVPFDCLEFSPNLRCIDQASDTAFLVMDLLAHGRTDLAYAYLNTWLEETGDYAALEVLRFYLVYRAMVRVKVASIQLEHVLAESSSEPALQTGRYLDLALALAKVRRPPRLVLMHGFSGSGKTWLSQRLMQVMPAIRVRSDLERKRLHGLRATDHGTAAAASGLYGTRATERTYAVLAGHCRTGLESGFHMIADATFLDRGQRTRFLDMAAEAGARATILDCTASPETLRERIRQRCSAGADASDADLAVLEYQLGHFDELSDEEQRVTLRVPAGHIKGFLHRCHEELAT